jgi:hypothetical protein
VKSYEPRLGLCYSLFRYEIALFEFSGIYAMMRYARDFSGPCIHGAIPEGLMSTSDDRNIRHKLAQLKQEHRDLDEAIIALEAAQDRDQLRLTRLKKRKLGLKDEIARLEDQLLPDIIA